MSDPVSRRRFLAATGAALGLGPVLAACGGGTPTAAGCEGYDQLSPTDLQMRQNLNYVDLAPTSQQFCGNCRLFNQPAGGSPCGGCQLFQGPVSPKGYCTGWVQQAA